MKCPPKCAHQSIHMSRRTSFSSAHLYKQSKWTREKNASEFGLCFSEFGHGHNYVLEAFFEGPIAAKTGLLVNLMDIDPILKKLTDEFDHQHLNFTHPHFKSEVRVPTTENIAAYLWEKLKIEIEKLNIDGLRLYKIKLLEDDDLWVEIRA